MKFLLNCTRPLLDNSGAFQGTVEDEYVYDNETSEVFNKDGKLVNIKPTSFKKYSGVAKAVSESTPLGKTNVIKTLKIQLGLSCNYSCEYCSQRFVPNIDHSNLKYMNIFLKNLDKWLTFPPEKIEFWGGEPLVYWKILKPLAEELRSRYPKTNFLMITNGSLITEEMIDWFYDLGFSLAVSHDGPGQNVRGPDPFDDPAQRKVLFRLFNKFLPEGRISINSMIHRENMDRVKIQKFFEDLFNLNNQDNFSIGEGGFIDVYDEGGKKNVPQSIEEHVAHRKTTILAIRSGSIDRFSIARDRIGEWLDSWGNYRPTDVLGQKCGMDKENTIAVDLQGNVLTCQNVTAVSKAPNGNSHKIGHVNMFDKIKLNTATHWKFREECSKCPVLQVCKGSCMFLQGEYFKLSCDAAYSDHVAFFAAAFEVATGAIPYKITAISDDYQLPPDRIDVWGVINGVEPKYIDVRDTAINKNF